MELSQTICLPGSNQIAVPVTPLAVYYERGSGRNSSLLDQNNKGYAEYRMRHVCQQRQGRKLCTADGVNTDETKEACL